MSKRIQRVNALIKKELGQIFLKELDFPKDILITITRVETSLDVEESNVWISVFPEKKMAEIIGILNKRIFFLQQKLNEKLRMRPIPRIRFLEETSTSEAGKIEEILAKLENSGRVAK